MINSFKSLIPKQSLLIPKNHQRIQITFKSHNDFGNAYKTLDKVHNQTRYKVPASQQQQQQSYNKQRKLQKQQQYNDLDLLKSQEQFKESAEVKAYCYGLPKEWSKGQLKLYFDEKLNFQSGITNIYYAYNKIGEFTGKATIVFKNENLKENWVTKFDGEFIDSNDVLQRIIVKNFEVKKKKQFKKSDLKKINTLYLFNLPYTLTDQKLYEMAEDFGEVLFINLPMKNSYQNKGHGFIRFANGEQAIQFMEFYEDREIEHRKMRIQIQNFEFDRVKEKPYLNKFDRILNKNNYKNALLEENIKLYEYVITNNTIDSNS